MKRKKTHPLPPLDFDKCLLVMKAVLGDRARPDAQISIGITTTSGRRMAIDTRSDPVISEAPRDDVALSIITSEEALSGLLTGTLDLANAEGPLFIWGGDIEHWAHLVDAVSAYNSVSVRALKGGAR